jgi:transglutaminase superfamily protein
LRLGPPLPRQASLLAAVVLSTSLAAGAEAPVDEWHLVLIQGKPAGYWHLRIEPRAAGGYTTKLDEKIVLKRATDLAEVTKSTESDEDAEGKILAYRQVQRMSAEPRRTVGIVKDGALHITETVGEGAPSEAILPLDPAAVGTRRLNEMMKTLDETGEKIEAVVFLPEFRAFARQKSVLQAKEGGLSKITSTWNILPGISQEEWYDGAFQLQKVSFALPGLEFTTRRASLEEVLKQDFGSPPEIFLATTIRPKGQVPRSAREVTYRLKLSAGAFPPSWSAGEAAGQEVREEGDRARLIRTRRVEPAAGAERGKDAPPGLDAYLRSGGYIQSDDEAIRKTAKEVAGAEKDPVKAARLLESWVHENVRDKNLKTAFGSAREVLDRREGDCTEHSVLLAALLRASGIPARVTAGLVHQKGIFAGHMWTEAYLGRWVPLDAALGSEGAGPDRIAFSVSSLDETSLPQLLLDVVLVIGALDIEVVGVEKG